MLECVWCKKKMGQEWSKDKEPLCSECAHKYHFGVEQGMIKGKVSELTKEQRREVSVALYKIECFVRALRFVGRESLTGRMRLLLRVSGITLFIACFIILGLISLFLNLDSDTGNPLLWVMGVGLFYLMVALLFLLHNRIRWLLKFYQINKEAKNAGYETGLWHNEEINKNEK